MNYQVNESNEILYVECLPDGGVVRSERDALDLVAACGESGATRLMIHAGNLSPEFFDLKTRLAGEVLLKLAMYRIKLAAVLTPELVGDGRFYEMVIEANRRNQEFHVFYDRAEAEAWLIGD